jgi:MbtH protein
MTNPFDDETGTFVALVNQENQHSLWPMHIAVPAGWSAVFGPDTRQSCMDYVESAWTDLRPASIVSGGE